MDVHNIVYALSDSHIFIDVTVGKATYRKVERNLVFNLMFFLWVSEANCHECCPVLLWERRNCLFGKQKLSEREKKMAANRQTTGTNTREELAELVKRRAEIAVSYL